MVLRRVTQRGKPRRGHSLIFVSMAPRVLEIFRKAAMNYRSAVVFGTAMPVESSEEKLRVLRAFSEHLIKGRWQEVRSPSPSEAQEGAFES